MDAAFADQQLADYVAELAAGGGEADVASLREQGARRARERLRGPEMQEIRELRIGELAARLYRPAVESAAVIVYFHGGGWTIGSVETHDRVCRLLAQGSGNAVVSIEYRLAPENPWPAAIDDAVAVLRWAASERGRAEHDAGRVAVAGDSAGGTLAALACIRLRDEFPAALPALQVLVCANTNLTGAHDSMRQKAVGFGLTAAGVEFFKSQWVPERERWADPGVSPLHATDLHGLPPALIITAEHDVLRDEGDAYAAKLSDADVPVRHRCEPGLVHNFIMLDLVSPACAAAIDRVCADLRSVDEWPAS